MIEYSNIVFAENASLVLPSSLSGDGKYSGIVENGTLGETVAYGEIVYFKAADSKWWLADASAISTSGDVKIGCCVVGGAGNATTVILLYGKVRADAKFPTFTISAPVFISETAGAVTNTAPTTTDSVTRKIGFGDSSDILFFNPSNDYTTEGTTEATTEALLASLSTTQGGILIRGSSAWTALAAGTAGQILYTGGAGANPSWGNVPASSTETVVAAEALGGHRVVTMSGNYASKDNSADKFNILGITQGAVISGATATVTTYGTITESSWNWTAGLPVFLSTNGQLTQSVPTSGFRLIIGRAKSATTLFVDISEPIVII